MATSSSSTDNSLDNFINQYCTVHGLTSEGGKAFNGKTVFVVKPDAKGGGERLAALFMDRLGDTNSDFVSLKASNLKPLFPVRVGASTINGAGMGLFATRDIAYGEIILNEPSFLAIPPSARQCSPAQFRRFVFSTTNAAEREVLSQLTFKGPHPSAPIMAHVDASTDAGRWVLRGVVNSVGRPRGDMNSDAGNDDSSFLFPISSRINHSCQGKNAWRTVHGASDPRAIVQALRPIRAGEEIFFKYGPVGAEHELAMDHSIDPSSCRCAVCIGACRREEQACDMVIRKLQMRMAQSRGSNNGSCSIADIAAESRSCMAEGMKIEETFAAYRAALIAQKVLPHIIEPIKLNSVAPFLLMLISDLMSKADAKFQQVTSIPQDEDDSKALRALYKDFTRAFDFAVKTTLLLCCGNAEHPAYLSQVASSFNKVKELVGKMPAFQHCL